MKKTKPLHIGNLVITWMLAFAMAFALGSCNSTKNIDKTSKETETAIKIDSSAYFHEKVDSLQRTLTEERNIRKTGVVFNRQPIISNVPGEELIDDCPPCANNEIHVKADGSFTAKGDIAAFNMEEDQLRKQLVEVINERELETSHRKVLEQQLKEVVKNKIVEKKTKVLTQWWIWLIFLAAGFFIGFRTCWKYKDRIKNEI